MPKINTTDGHRAF